jgi:hypothetical protein
MFDEEVTRGTTFEDTSRDAESRAATELEQRCLRQQGDGDKAQPVKPPAIRGTYLKGDTSYHRHLPKESDGLRYG